MKGEPARGARPPPGEHNKMEDVTGSLGESRIGSPNTAEKQLASLGESRIGSPKTGGSGPNKKLDEKASRPVVNGRRSSDRASVVENFSEVDIDVEIDSFF